MFEEHGSESIDKEKKSWIIIGIIIAIVIVVLIATFYIMIKRTF